MRLAPIFAIVTAASHSLTAFGALFVRHILGHLPIL